MSQFTWLITGASSGLGANIALAALEAGHCVVATARNITKAKASYPQVEQKGGHWLTLDVTSPDTQSIVEKAVREHDVNVVVNSAGYALRGVLEDLSMSDIRDQLETNVIGLLSVSKGCIPILRSRRSGTIVNLSSTSGMSGNAGYTLYAASKFAVEGATEALAAELADFNIRVLLVEPGGFRTNFQGAVSEPPMSEAYRVSTAGQLAQRMAGVHGKQPGDPAKAGQAIVEVVTASSQRAKDVEGQLRLILGKDAIQRMNTKIRNLSTNVEKVKPIAEWAVFEDGV